MAIWDVDHVNVTTSDLERMRRFYTEVLGLTEGVPAAFFPSRRLDVRG